MVLINLFAAVGIIIFIGLLGEYVFEKTNIPDVIWLMLLGIIVGRIYDFKHSLLYDIAPIFTTFALIFILFEGSIHINLKKLVKGISGGTLLSLLNFIFSVIIVAIAMRMIGWDLLEGMLLGAMIGGASSAVIIPLTKKINVKPQTALVLTFESAISDVLCIIGALTILNIIILKSFSIASVMKKLFYSFSAAILLGIIGGLIWIKLQKKFQRFSKSYMATIATLLLLYSFVEFLDSNGAIACLAFGIIIGNSKKILGVIEKETNNLLTSSEKFFFSEISFFVKTFFFVYLGLLIDLRNVGMILLGFLITLLLFLVRPLAISIVSGKSKVEEKDRIFMEILTPKGLAAAVLAQLPVQYDLPHSTQFSTIVLSVIFFSILLSTIGVFLTEKDKFRGLNRMLNLKKMIVKDEKEKKENK